MKVKTYQSQVQMSGKTGGAYITDIRGMSDTGAEVMPQALAGIGDLVGKLAQKRMAFADSMAAAKSVEIMRNAELDYQTKTEQDPDTNNYPKYWQESIGNAQQEIGKLKYGTGEGRQRNEIETKTWGELFSKQAEVNLIKQQSRDTLAATQAAFETEVMLDDGTTQSVIKQNAAMEAYKSALNHSYSPKVANAIFNAKSIELKSKKNLQFGQNLAASNPEQALILFKDRLDKFSKGQKGLDEFGLGAEDYSKLIGYANQQQERDIVQFDNDINGEMIKLDNTPDLSQMDFDNNAEKLKENILNSKIPNVHKTKLLADLKRWKNGEGEVDYPRLLALNTEMDVAMKTGIVDPTIKDRINQANLEGAMGGRNKGGAQKYSSMIRRFNSLKFDERLNATSSIVSNFEKENADDPRLIFLFQQAKNKIIEENPKADIKEIFIKISGLAESYSIKSETDITKEMSTSSYRKGQVINRGGKNWIIIGFDKDGMPLVDEAK